VTVSGRSYLVPTLRLPLSTSPDELARGLQASASLSAGYVTWSADLFSHLSVDRSVGPSVIVWLSTSPNELARGLQASASLSAGCVLLYAAPSHLDVHA
jgi:hypothetical protein